jgi:hypothetical protein
MESVFILLAVLAAPFMALGVLFGGLFNFARNGQGYRKYSNKFMRWRIIVQFLGLVGILFIFWL